MTKTKTPVEPPFELPDWLETWKRVDLWWRDGTDDGDYQRYIYTDGRGTIIEFTSADSFDTLVTRKEIPDDAPQPMFPDTERNGVIGYMCKIDFECELGSAVGGNMVRPTASEALCAGTCGVVQVEVIGHKVIIPEGPHMDDADDDVIAAYTADVTKQVSEFDKTGKIPDLSAWGKYGDDVDP